VLLNNRKIESKKNCKERDNLNTEKYNFILVDVGYRKQSRCQEQVPNATEI